MSVLVHPFLHGADTDFFAQAVQVKKLQLNLDPGATTFRIKTCGLTIFHDAWLEKPTCLQQSLKIDEVDDVDYIFISHAHFDQ